MFISAKAFFDDHTQDNIRLLIRADTEFGPEWLIAFRKKVINLTPMKTGALRRSLITRPIPHGAEVSWRMPYASVQNDGRHTVWNNVITKDQYNGGFGLIPGGRTYFRYKYTTPGTGPNFAEKAAKLVHQNDVPAIWRKIGLTK